MVGLVLGVVALDAIIAERDLMADLGLPIVGLRGRFVREIMLRGKEHGLIASYSCVHASK